MRLSSESRRNAGAYCCIRYRMDKQKRKELRETIERYRLLYMGVTDPQARNAIEEAIRDAKMKLHDDEEEATAIL